MGRRYKACLIDAKNHLLTCQRHIKCNPVRAGMVTSPPYCIRPGYQAIALGKDIAIHASHPVYLRLGPDAPARERTYPALFKPRADIDANAKIREATNKNLAVGSARIKHEIKGLGGLRITGKRRGPKPKKDEFLL